MAENERPEWIVKAAEELVTPLTPVAVDLHHLAGLRESAAEIIERHHGNEADGRCVDYARAIEELQVAMKRAGVVRRRICDVERALRSMEDALNAR